MKDMLNKMFEMLARWRTWLFNGVLALLLVLPEIINSPEILAVIPHEYQRWFLIAVFLINILMRPRAAVLPNDLEAAISRAKK